jgi:hypothetical protein
VISFRLLHVDHPAFVWCVEYVLESTITHTVTQFEYTLTVPVPTVDSSIRYRQVTDLTLINKVKITKLRCITVLALPRLEIAPTETAVR